MGNIVILGMFDGVHMGHSALFGAAREIRNRTEQSILVYTFKNHPTEFITGQKIPFLMTQTEREARMRELGADEIIFDVFNAKVRDTGCADFVKALKTRLCAVHVVAGYNYTFGKSGSGNTETLINLCNKLGMCADIVPQVKYGGETVSSTRIRNEISAGNMETASTLLMQNYCMSGIVEKCRQVGRKMGYPTANIRNSEGKVLPRMGVYATKTHIGERDFYSITNVGTNPTFGEFGTSVETHILDFDEDIYGEKITVEFLHFVRDQRRFGSMDELRRQIQSDTEGVRAYFRKLKK